MSDSLFSMWVSLPESHCFIVNMNFMMLHFHLSIDWVAHAASVSHLALREMKIAECLKCEISRSNSTLSWSFTYRLSEMKIKAWLLCLLLTLLSAAVVKYWEYKNGGQFFQAHFLLKQSYLTILIVIIDYQSKCDSDCMKNLRLKKRQKPVTFEFLISYGESSSTTQSNVHHLIRKVELLKFR